MGLQKVSFFMATASLAVAAVGAKQIASPLVGCDDLECPTEDGTSTGIQCTISDETHTAIGLAPIPAHEDDGAVDGLSWVKGLHANVAASTSEVRASFYLGTPPGKELGASNACAVFFHNTGVQFPGGWDSDEVKGTCSDAIEQRCIDGLKKRAVEACCCNELADALQNEEIDGCGDVFTAHIRVHALSEARRISGEQNSSTNCWPIIPEENDLSLIESFEVKGTLTEKEVRGHMLSVTPIMTVFLGGGWNEGTVPVAQMACLKASAVQKERDEDEDEDDSEEDSASRGEPNLFALFVLTLVGLLVLPYS